MTAQQMNGAPERERMRGNPGETYEQRFPRYANNAGITAGYSAEYAARQRKAAGLHANAAAYARVNGDDAAAELYDEMAAAALDAAEALDDLADTARQIKEHYQDRQQQEIAGNHERSD
jgi:hypothetical protein